MGNGDIGIGRITKAVLLSRQEEVDQMHKWKGWPKTGASVQLGKRRQRICAE